MRRCISVLAGLFGLWFFGVGLTSVVVTPPGSFLGAMWPEVLLGAVLLIGSVLLWRGRAPHGTDPRAHVADECGSGARD